MRAQNGQPTHCPLGQTCHSPLARRGLQETPQTQACHPRSITHPQVTLPPLQGATQTMESQDTQGPTNRGLQHQLQQDNTSPSLGSREGSGKQGSPQPCQRQGDINWGIHSTAVWGIPPSLPHQNPIPTHPPRCPQHGERSHNHSVLSTKYLRHRPSINTLLSIAMQNFLILPLARTPLSARDKYQSSFT